MSVLDNPLALQDEAKWQASNKVLADAKDVIDRGSKLQTQINTLETVIRRARTKVTLALSSDGETNIEIYRMGNLGVFREHAVALYPGRYVVVGKKSGCRDVREELVLDGTQSNVDLNIQCREKI